MIMTVKELKERLKQFDDNLIVMIPCENPDECDYFPFNIARSVSQGVNEADCCVFIDSYDEDDD